MKDDVFTDGLFEGVFVLLELVEDFFIVGDVKAGVYFLFLGVDIDADIVGRCAETKIIPVLGLRFTKVELFLECRIGAHLVVECLPEFKFQAVGLGHTLYALHSFRPIVRFLNHIKLWGEEGIVNLPQFDFNEEEADVGIGMLVQPFDGLTVFVACV